MPWLSEAMKDVISCDKLWAGVRLYTGSFDLAQPCVFVKQLPGPILCALP